MRICPGGIIPGGIMPGGITSPSGMKGKPPWGMPPGGGNPPSPWGGMNGNGCGIGAAPAFMGNGGNGMFRGGGRPLGPASGRGKGKPAGMLGFPGFGTGGGMVSKRRVCFDGQTRMTYYPLH